ncbi:MAG: hypothetical protein ABGX71_02805 [Methyloprofundus sp.]|nr:hypothetical protein [Methyloprofundus sp.]
MITLVEQVCDFASLDVSIEISDIFEDIVAEKQYPDLFFIKNYERSYSEN